MKTTLANVQVTIQRYQYVNGRRQLVMTNLGTTNDIGEYRLFAIPPGQYVISATLRAFNFTNANMLLYWHLLERAVQRGKEKPLIVGLWGLTALNAVMALLFSLRIIERNGTGLPPA